MCVFFKNVLEHVLYGKIVSEDLSRTLSGKRYGLVMQYARDATLLITVAISFHLCLFSKRHSVITQVESNVLLYLFELNQ